MLFVLTLHHLVAITNAYITTTMGASVDAITFHRSAIKIINHQMQGYFGSGAYFYQLVLAFFYKLFGVSQFMGEELSVFAFLLSCFVLIKLYHLLSYFRYLPLLILLYGALPSMVLLGSVTLRESWQILFFMLTIYFCLQNLFFDHLASWLGILSASFMLALFHEGFVIFIFMLASVLITYSLIAMRHETKSARQRTHILSILLTVLTAITIITFLRANLAHTPELEAFHALYQGNALQFIADYRARVLSFYPRTSYAAHMDFSSIYHLAPTLLINFIDYLFAPFPWQVVNAMDTYAFLESLVRMLLIITAFTAYYTANAKQKKSILFLLIVYMLMSFLWSLGTISYGTSIRHHLVTYWLLILLFGACLNHLLAWHNEKTMIYAKKFI